MRRPLSSSLPSRNRLAAFGVALVTLCGGSLHANPYYWDANAAVAGAGTTPTGTWGTDAFFTSNSAGTGDPSTFITTPLSTDTVQFCAGPTAGQGTFVVTVSGTQSIQEIFVRQTGAFTISGGTINLGSGGIDNSLRTLLASNDATGFTIASNISLTANQTWVTNVGNGTNATTLISGNTTGTGNLTLSNGSGRAFNITGSLNMTGTLTAALGNSGSPITISGVVGSNVTGLSVAFTTGAGNILTLSSASATVGNTYSGATSVTQGTLRLNDSSTTATASLTGGGAVNVAGTTAVLAGQNGVSSGLLTVTGGGQISPGLQSGASVAASFQSVSTLHLGTTGGVTLTQATLNFDLANTAAGTSDRIILGTGTTATGTLSLGMVTFNFENGTLANTTLETGVAYTLITAANTTGFDPNNIKTFFLGNLQNSGYTASYTDDGSNLFVTFSVPEPSVTVGVSLAVLGLLGWKLAARRRAA